MEQDKGRLPEAAAGDAGTGAGSNRIGRAKEFVGEKYGAATDAVKTKYSSVKEKVDDIDITQMTDQVRNYVRSNPGKALLISVGVGFLIGLLLRRGRDDD